MKDIIARCGYRCDLCPAFRDNNKGSEDQIRFSDGLIKYYGHYLPIERCYCDGCYAEENDKTHLIDPECKVRACVIARGFKNCALCEEYPCEILREKFVFGEEVIKNYGAPIPPEDYNLFIKPYESKDVLDALREKEIKKRKRKKAK